MTRSLCVVATTAVLFLAHAAAAQPPLFAQPRQMPREHAQWLVLAKAVAAEHTGLAESQLRLAGTLAMPWGWSYEWAVPFHPMQTVGVRMPERRVWRAPLSRPWRAPPGAVAPDLDEPELAQRIGELFAAQVLHLPTKGLVLAKVDGTAASGRYFVEWSRCRGRTLTPGFVKVSVDVDEQSVTWYADLDVPLAVAAEPLLAEDAAVRAAADAAARWRPPRGPDIPARGWRMVKAEAAVVYITEGRPGQTAQALRWFVTLDELPPSEGWTGRPPRRSLVTLGATTPAKVLKVEVWDEPQPAMEVPGSGHPADLGLLGQQDLATAAQTWGALTTAVSTAIVSSVVAEPYRPPPAARARLETTRAGEQQALRLHVAYEAGGTGWRLLVAATDDEARRVAIKVHVERPAAFCRTAGVPTELPALIRVAFAPLAARGRAKRFGRVQRGLGYAVDAQGNKAPTYFLGWPGYMFNCWMMPGEAGGAWFEFAWDPGRPL